MRRLAVASWAVHTATTALRRYGASICVQLAALGIPPRVLQQFAAKAWASSNAQCPKDVKNWECNGMQWLTRPIAGPICRSSCCFPLDAEESAAAAFLVTADVVLLSVPWTATSDHILLRHFEKTEMSRGENGV